MSAVVSFCRSVLSPSEQPLALWSEHPRTISEIRSYDTLELGAQRAMEYLSSAGCIKGQLQSPSNCHKKTATATSLPNRRIHAQRNGRMGHNWAQLRSFCCCALALRLRYRDTVTDALSTLPSRHLEPTYFSPSCSVTSRSRLNCPSP